MGKTATRAGVQVTKTVTTKDGSGNFIDLFAKSEPGQTLVITGTGVAATAMREDGNGAYYARIRVDGAAPADLAVTNTTDNPKSVDHVDPAQFGDKVHVNSAIYDNDTKSLIVLAQSGDPAAALTLAGYPSAVQDTSGTSQRFTVSDLNAPPADVLVTSSKGGSDGDDVVITGAAFTAQQVVASIFADATDVATGQKVTLDGTGSTGTILSYAWTQTKGPAVTFTNNTAQTSFTPTVAGQYQFKLTVTGAGAGNTSSENININAFGSAAPVANAGPDQLNVAPTSTVTLNGTASAFAASYTWSQTGGPAVTLSRTDVANPTFIAPANSTQQTLTFTLTVKDGGWPPAVDGHRHGHHRPRRPRRRLGAVQAGRRRMAHPWHRAVLLGQQRGHLHLEQAGLDPGRPRHADAGARRRCVQLRLPVEERPGRDPADGRRHDHRQLGDGWSRGEPDVRVRLIPAITNNVSEGRAATSCPPLRRVRAQRLTGSDGGQDGVATCRR